MMHLVASGSHKKNSDVRYLVSVKKIKAGDEVCDVEVVDDDEVANEIFWDE